MIRTYKHNSIAFPSSRRSKSAFLNAIFASNSTGKERDEETGYGYFGARYMDHELMTGWLSVDPMMDKYPNITPYAYCNWNPMKLVDPDGRDVYINGDDDSKAKALQQIQQKSKNMKFSINEQGQLTYEGKAKTRQEKYMKNIIECQNIHVNLQVQDNSVFEGKTLDIGGAFGGNELSDDKKTVTAKQVVNVNSTAYYDKKCKNLGNLIWHEIAEAYEGGHISIKQGVNADPKLKDVDNAIFDQAHFAAGRYFPGTVLESESPLLPQGILPTFYGSSTNTSPMIHLISDLSNKTTNTYTYIR